MAPAPKCPKCNNLLVIKPGWLNSDQINAIKAGDWYCKCHNNHKCTSPYAYFHNNELNITTPGSSKNNEKLPLVKIIASAVKYDDLIFVLPKPARHYQIIHKMHSLGLPNESKRCQGFILDNGIFVNRKEAMIIAIQNGQVDENRTITKEDLFSEDLW